MGKIMSSLVGLSSTPPGYVDSFERQLTRNMLNHICLFRKMEEHQIVLIHWRTN